MTALGATNNPNPEDTDMANHETEKISMTLTTNSIEWLGCKYPDSQSTQEAVRMAISDARQHHIGIENVRASDDGSKAVVDMDQ
jgi:hypothetical protein